MKKQGSKELYKQEACDLPPKGPIWFQRELQNEDPVSPPLPGVSKTMATSCGKAPSGWTKTSRPGNPSFVHLPKHPALSRLGLQGTL